MKTYVINLFGGPGCGKSTTAADIFVQYKRQGEDVELVQEFVKTWAWQGRKIKASDQSFIIKQQYRRERILYRNVRYIVTDSPYLLSPFYERKYFQTQHTLRPALTLLKRASDQGVIHVNFLLKRTKKYNPKGRYETAEQAMAIDQEQEQFLNELNIPFHVVNVPDEEKSQFIIEKTNEIVSRVETNEQKEGAE